MTQVEELSVTAPGRQLHTLTHAHPHTSCTQHTLTPSHGTFTQHTITPSHTTFTQHTITCTFMQ